MILLLDIGNTHLKWQQLEGQSLAKCGRVVLDDTPLSNTFTKAWRTLERPERVVATNVAGVAMAEALVQWISGHWQCPCDFIVPVRQACGVVNGYHEPERLGADRWAALIGAWQRVHGAVCVVDCGTAVTLDVLAVDGRHMGGLIIPGFELMAGALASGARGIIITEEDSGLSRDLLGRNTGECIAAGVLQAAAGLVERTLADLKRRMEAPLACLVTGGDGERLLAHLDIPCQYAPQLVFEGLAQLAAVAEET